jgi:predicted ATP-grasp superfamily ATP-dependent carboligase
MGRRVPLMYGSDEALGLVQANRERLQRYFLFLVPEPDVGSALISKDRFAAFARHRGLPVPRSLTWDGDGPGSVRGTQGEVLVKPCDKADWHHSALCRALFNGDGKALVFESGEAAAANPLVAEHHRALTFQEYVPGGDDALWSFHGFADERGTVLASFVGRKIRTYPTLTGESAFIEIAEDASLEAVGREVALRCPLKGPFKMDFKRDPRDGRWHLLEINARYNLWHYLGAVNGLNLTQVAYDYLLRHERPAGRRADTRYRWISLDLDFKAYRELSGRGELTFARWAGSLLCSRSVSNLFSWSDPLPWVSLWRRRITRRVARIPALLFGSHRSWRSSAS